MDVHKSLHNYDVAQNVYHKSLAQHIELNGLLEGFSWLVIYDVLYYAIIEHV